MRQQHRSHARYAPPDAPAFRPAVRRHRDQTSRYRRRVAGALAVQEPADPVDPLRGILLAIPVSAVLWGGVAFGMMKAVH